MGRSINQNMYPSNTGYSYQDVDGSMHRSEGWRMLEQVVRSYRVRVGRDPGDVWGDIMEYACKMNSSLCVNDAPHQLVQADPASTYAATIGQKVSNWVSSIMQRYQMRQTRQVSVPEAQRRAAICANCPRQIAIPSSCSTCHTQMATFRSAILDGNAPANPNLKGCSALGEDTQLSCHLELEPITTDAQPSFCWRKSV